MDKFQTKLLTATSKFAQLEKSPQAYLSTKRKIRKAKKNRTNLWMFLQGFNASDIAFKEKRCIFFQKIEKNPICEPPTNTELF